MPTPSTTNLICLNMLGFTWKSQNIEQCTKDLYQMQLLPHAIFISSSSLWFTSVHQFVNREAYQMLNLKLSPDSCTSSFLTEVEHWDK